MAFDIILSSRFAQTVPVGRLRLGGGGSGHMCVEYLHRKGLRCLGPKPSKSVYSAAGARVHSRPGKHTVSCDVHDVR